VPGAAVEITRHSDNTMTDGMALAAAEAPATDHQAAHGSVAEVMLKSDNTSACGAQRAFMSSAANAAASTMCNSYQVPRQPPQGRFIASELHRPEAPNMPSELLRGPGGVTPMPSAGTRRVLGRMPSRATPIDAQLNRW